MAGLIQHEAQSLLKSQSSHPDLRPPPVLSARLDLASEPEAGAPAAHQFRSPAHMTYVILYRLSLCAYVTLSLAAILPLPCVLAFWFTLRLSWCLVL